jgi:MraZ protein
LYYGESNTAVDEKGRVNVPLHFKTLMKALNHDTWYVTRGFDGALFLFHAVRWHELLKTLQTPSGLNPRLLDFRRLFLGSVAVVKMDAQGRFNIPAPLRQYAGIDREAVILGVDDHLELWSVKGWTTFQESQAEAYKRMADELFGGLRAGVGQPTEGSQND